MSGVDDNSQPDANWEHLESQFEGTQERVEAIYWNEITQTANDLKGIMRSVLPPEVMARLEPNEPAEVTFEDLEMGPDGQPIVISVEEAHAVMGAREDINEVVRDTVDRITIVDRQQIDIDLKRAETAGDKDELHKLGLAKLELESKIDKLEFFATVTALHPISEDYRAEFLTQSFDNTVYSSFCVNTHAKQVALIEVLDSQYQRLTHFLREHTPAQLEVERRQAEQEGDIRWLEHINHIAEQVEDKAVAEAKMRKVFQDIASGFATIYTSPSKVLQDEDQTATPPKDIERTGNPEKKPYFDMLAELPGQDPVALAVAGRYAEVPQAGWIINAMLRPGESGKVELMHVQEGGYKFSDTIAGSEHSPMVWLKMEADKSGSANVIYKNYKRVPNKGYADVEDHYEDITEMSTGKSLLAWHVPMSIAGQKGGGRSQNLRSIDPAYAFAHGGQFGTSLELTRMTDDPEIAKDIVRRIGLAMGMSDDDAQFMVGKFEDRRSFTELKQLSTSEQKHFFGPKDNVIYEYANGSKLVERGGNEYVVEADGSEWLKRSSYGLSYDGPDDMIGYYSE
jgi:hypothetical protein